MGTTYVIEDTNNTCLSAIYMTTTIEYLSLINKAYSEKGGIEGQRAPLKTKTAIRIRNRMVEDIKNGAILPPIVIGVVLSKYEYDTFKIIDNAESIQQFLTTIDPDKLSVIDGMQRTTALQEAVTLNSNCEKNPVRIELWMAQHVNNLIYRMLILNTGQVPWDIKRQLATVYKPILNEIKAKVQNIDILEVDEAGRRVSSGQYQSSKLIEFFLAFTSRKSHIDIKEKVAEDFERMNATEAISNNKFIDNFITLIDYLSKIDLVFGNAKRDSTENPDGKFKSGKDIFTSSPAGIGFMSSSASFIYGPPGFDRTIDEQQKNVDKLITSLNGFLTMIKDKNPKDLNEFLEIESLNEKLNRKSGKVGEFERDYFHKAFTTLFEHGKDLKSLGPCWAAY